MTSRSRVIPRGTQVPFSDGGIEGLSTQLLERDTKVQVGGCATVVSIVLPGRQGPSKPRAIARRRAPKPLPADPVAAAIVRAAGNADYPGTARAAPEQRS